MKRGLFVVKLCILFSIMFFGFSVSVLALSETVKLDKIVKFHSDGKCGRSGHGWLNDCNTDRFTGNGPGGCFNSKNGPGGISGCYFWQPSENPKVFAETKIDLPSAGTGNIAVWMFDYGGGTYLNEKVNVYVNGVYVGTTADDWCNNNDRCNELGPFIFNFNNINYQAGTNTIKFEAVDDGGSVSVHKYTIEYQPWVCTPNAMQTQACGNCGTQTRLCLSNGQWGSWGACNGQGVCAPNAMQTQACGNCGTQTRICSSSCQWNPWGLCTGEGVCSPGQIEAQSCDTGLPGICGVGNRLRICEITCQWGLFGDCQQVNQPTIEICNGLDDDCDGLIDEGLTQNCGTGLCAGVRTCVNGEWGDCSSNGLLCSTLDCDYLDTACRNYNDVNLYCDDNGECGIGVCGIFVDLPIGTICGNNIIEYGCPWGNNLDDDTGLRMHEFQCDGIGNCADNTNPWQVDEYCSINQFCFWDGLGNGDENYYCIPLSQCIPGELQSRTCGITNVGVCEFGAQNRICLPNGVWSGWGECIGAVYPQPEICNGLDDDCDGYIDEGGVCELCEIRSVSIRGSGGDIEYIDGFSDIDNQDVRFSAWLRRNNNGEYSGILSINLKGKVNGENIRLTTKGKVREILENTCSVLKVDNSYWSLATYQAPGEAPITITFDSIVYTWDKENGFVDVYGLGPYLNFNVTDIRVKVR